MSDIGNQFKEEANVGRNPYPPLASVPRQVKLDAVWSILPQSLKQQILRDLTRVIGECLATVAPTQEVPHEDP